MRQGLRDSASEQVRYSAKVLQQERAIIASSCAYGERAESVEEVVACQIRHKCHEVGEPMLLGYDIVHISEPLHVLVRPTHTCEKEAEEVSDAGEMLTGRWRSVLVNDATQVCIIALINSVKKSIDRLRHCDSKHVTMQSLNSMAEVGQCPRSNLITKIFIRHASRELSCRPKRRECRDSIAAFIEIGRQKRIGLVSRPLRVIGEHVNRACLVERLQQRVGDRSHHQVERVRHAANRRVYAIPGHA